jgi:membrane protein
LRVSFFPRALTRALFVSSAFSALALFGRRLLGLARQVHARFIEDRCSRAAGALAFTTLFALVPLVAVAFAVLSVFPMSRGWMDAVLDFVYGNFVPTAGETIARYVEQFAANAGRLTVWGLLFVVATAIMLMSSIERTFNDIWHVERPRSRIHRLLGYWALLTLGPLLIGVSLSMTTALVSTPVFGPRSAFSGIRAALFEALPWAFEIAAFVLLYTVTPNRPVRLRHALVGGLFAAVLFEVAKRAFAFYVARLGSYQVIYGAVAALPVFLFWVYLSWLVILLGAVLTATLPEWKSLGRAAPEPRVRS